MKIYFDYAATTPVDARVLKAMLPFFGGKFGNPSSLHSFGQEAIRAVDEAREKVAGLLGADFREIIFTGSATEANNMALRGVIQAHRIDRTNKSNRTYRIIVSAVEHESILETVKDLERSGIEVVRLPVDRSGRVRVDKLKQALNERTVLVSVMYANNEIGAIQPIREIAQIISDFKKSVSTTYHLLPTTYPLFHTDAVQAFQYLDCDVSNLGVDLMTLSGHKIYGPKGIGALYIRPISPIGPISPIIIGGGQEFGLRSGTENVPLIVGMAEAMTMAKMVKEKETRRILGLRNYFLRGLCKTGTKFEINSPPGLYNILNLYFPGYPADELAARLDMFGIAVGTGSACASRAPEASHVLRALSFSETRAKHSIRISFGRPTTKGEIDIFLRCVRKLVR